MCVCVCVCVCAYADTIFDLLDSQKKGKIDMCYSAMDMCQVDMC